MDILIGPDSAPLHIANALASQPDAGGKPRILGLYGPTAPGRTGPVGAQHRTLQTALPCQPCFKGRCRLLSPDEAHLEAPCLQALEPKDVLAAIADMSQIMLAAG